MTAKNIIEKIWDAHIVAQTEGHPTVVAIDLILLHEVTSPQAFQTLKERGIKVANPQQCLATLDHSIPTRKNRQEIFDSAARKQVECLRENVKEHHIKFFDFDSQYQGIIHVMAPELGAIHPGMTVICGDSHTSTLGAFGSFAFGVGTTELTYALASSCLLLSKPKVMHVHFNGTKFNKGVFAKDVIMKLIADIGVGGAKNYVIEYSGEIITAMSMEERMTICNMSIECGARAGLIAPDATTFNYLKDRPYAPTGKKWHEAIEYWRSLNSDPGCHYEKEIIIDINNLQPMITWGTNPAQAMQINERIPKFSELAAADKSMAERALSYMQLQEGQRLTETPIDWAFIGSCTNGRIEDLRIAAKILKDQRVHPRVNLYIVPGSEQVLAQAKAEKLDVIFQAAGAEFRMPGCSMCLGMNDDRVPAGKRCISSTNRNFMGRQGVGSFTHLASPAMVAASATAGKIVSPQEYL